MKREIIFVILEYLLFAAMLVIFCIPSIGSIKAKVTIGLGISVLITILECIETIIEIKEKPGGNY